MIQYFYKLIFLKDLETDNEVFDLGLYSCKKNAIKKQEISKKLEGFRDYDFQHFKILRIGVNCLKKIQNKSGLKLFQLWHEYYNPQDDSYYFTEYEYFIDIDSANAKLEQLRKTTRLGKKFPNNFQISECIVDNYNDWSEGFNGNLQN